MAYINGKKVLQVVQSLGGGSGANLLTTTTDATESSGTYTLALTYLSDTPNVNDFVAYVNNGAITTLYKVTAVDSTNATLTKIGDIGGGGSQLYQHIIYFDKTDQKNCYGFYIITDSATKMTWREIANWLKLNNYQLLQNDSTIAKGYPNVFGRYTIGSTQYTMLLIVVNYEDTAIVPHANSLNTWSVQVQQTIGSSIPTYYEVIPL